MRLLTDNEIKFLKETRITPTVIQSDEWNRTVLSDKIKNTDAAEIYAHACIIAKQLYSISLDDFYNDLTKDYDGISLEEEAPYIIYCLLTEEELDRKTDAELLEWLKDWKYFFGYRKANEWDANIARHEAKGLFNGAREVRTYDDGSIYISGLED